MDAIKLVYDSYENDIGFVQSDEQGDHNHQSLKELIGLKLSHFTLGGNENTIQSNVMLCLMLHCFLLKYQLMSNVYLV